MAYGLVKPTAWLSSALFAAAQEWSYLRGGLTTIDRDYGIFNKIHHDIGTHVVHHLFPQASILRTVGLLGTDVPAPCQPLERVSCTETTGKQGSGRAGGG
jgi:hypothetical protein